MGAGQMPLGSVGMSTDVAVTARPVTQQGLKGMKTKPLGPGRQIADKNYYLSLLREKVSEIHGEIDTMRRDVQQMQTDNSQYQTLERKYESVYKDVRTLEGQLADFNLALDKLRTNTPVEEILDIYARLKEQNDYNRKLLDDAYRAAAKNEKEARDYDERVQMMHAQAAERLASLGEDLRQEYSDLQDESEMLAKQAQDSEVRLQELDQRARQLQQDFDTPEYKTHARGVDLLKKHKVLASKKKELQEDTAQHLSPEEMKEKLVQKVKDLNGEIEGLDKRVKSTEEGTDKLQELIEKKDEELKEAQKYAQKAKKYEAVYEREKKMQEFIESYPQLLQEENDKKGSLQNLVVALLKHISKGILQKESLPDVEKFEDMKGDLAFKEATKQQSEQTLSSLKQENDRMQAELERLAGLDVKLPLEIKQLKEKITEMKGEMGGFKTEEKLQQESNEAKKVLMRDKVKWKKMKDATKQQVNNISKAFETKKKSLEANPTMKALDQLENRLRTFSQQAFALEEFIVTMRRESDYEQLKADVLARTNDINNLLVAIYNSK